MSELHVKNHHLPAITSLLDSLELARQYAVLDDNGEILLDEGGGFTLRNPEQAGEFTVECQTLMNETITIPVAYVEQYGILTKALADYPGTFAGSEALAYDLLCEALEEATVKESV